MKKNYVNEMQHLVIRISSCAESCVYTLKMPENVIKWGKNVIAFISEDIYNEERVRLD